jgi:hypothetical protein
MSLNNDQRKTTFIELAKKYENAKQDLKVLQQQLELMMTMEGVDTYHQDPETGAVYKIYVPEGTFISFKKIDYKRTALTGEKGGTVLSKSEAESKGFTLSK